MITDTKEDGSVQSAVKSGASFTLANGKTLHLSAMGLRDWAEAQQQALQQYKRQQIKTWTQNADLMPEGKRDDWIRDAFQRAESIGPEDLPPKTMEIPVPDPSHPTELLKVDGVVQTVKQDVMFTLWWLSETGEGKLYATYLSMRVRQPGITLEEVDQLFIEAQSELDEVANTVGDLSRQRLGNEPNPPATN